MITALLRRYLCASCPHMCHERAMERRTAREKQRAAFHDLMKKRRQERLSAALAWMLEERVERCGKS